MNKDSIRTIIEQKMKQTIRENDDIDINNIFSMMQSPDDSNRELGNSWLNMYFTKQEIAKYSKEYFGDLSELMQITGKDWTELVGLTLLDLTDKKLKSIPFFGKLTLLQHIRFSYNRIKSINDNSFNGLINLKSLDFLHCGLKYLERGCFNGLSNIESLNISGNNLGGLNDSLKNLSSLKYLDISYNGLGFLREGVLSALINLETLDIQNNGINGLENGCFTGLKNLKKLNIMYNNITTLQSGVFYGLSNIETINLFNNKIVEVDVDVFHNLNKLKECTLGGGFALRKTVNKLRETYPNVDF